MEFTKIKSKVSRYSAAEVAELIGNNVIDLYFDDLGSERSVPLHAFFQEANLPNLTTANFQEALNLSTEDPSQAIIRFEPLNDTLTYFIDQHIALGFAEKAKFIADLLTQHLDQLKLVVLGEDVEPKVSSQHPVYVVGLDSNGNIAGFQSMVVWT